MEKTDWEAVRAIYVEGLGTGQATFETEAPEWERWDQTHHSFARLVAREDEEIKGWAALSPVSSRPAYAGVAEVSIYVGERFRCEGIGRALLEALVESSEKNGVWTLQASVFPENAASIQLHRSCGFRAIGTRERIGVLAGHWRDTVLLERRSRVVGIE